MLKHGIFIINPLGYAVHYRHTVRGFVAVKDCAVQIFVHSNDGRWYVQKDAVVNGHSWEAEVCLGYEDSRGVYLVVAVAHDGTKKITDCPIDAIPDSLITSNTAMYTRNLPSI